MEFRLELNAKLHGFHGFHGFHAAIDPAGNPTAKQAHACLHKILGSRTRQAAEAEVKYSAVNGLLFA
jgi:hypothetical protein